MYMEYFHGNCWRRFDWIYKPWAKSWFSWEAERGLWVTAWQWSPGGTGVLGMGPGRAVDAIGASQRIWDFEALLQLHGERALRRHEVYAQHIALCVSLSWTNVYLRFLKCCPWLSKWLEPKRVLGKLCAFLPDCPNFMHFAYIYKHSPRFQLIRNKGGN